MAEPEPPDGISPPQPQVQRGISPSGASFAPHMTRGFLFADLRDYTGYVESHGDQAGAALLDRYRDLVRGVVAGTQGAEIRTEGDSFYVVFDSASAAVRAGQEIIAAADASDPADPIRVGVGVHAGETVETAEGFVGSAVNIAARLCSQAKAGELVVSDTVRALTRTYLDVDFEPLGSRRLKGVNEQIALYRVVPHAATTRVGAPPAGGRRRSWLLAAGLGAAAIVVLAVAGVAVLGGSRASPSAIPSAGPSQAAAATSPVPASSGPSASTGTGGLTLAEQELKARIPSNFQDYCSRSSPQQGSLKGAAASLQCNLPVDSSPEYAADTVWYDAFDQPGLMVPAVNAVKDREQLAEGECTTDHTQVIGTWENGISWNGLQACYTKAGAAWMLWTFTGDRIAVRAVRKDGNVSTMYSWWNQYGSYLRG